MRRGEENHYDPDFYTRSDPFGLDLLLSGSRTTVHLSWKDRIEATRVLTARGESLRTVAKALGVTPKSVARYRGILRERGC